MGYKVDNDQKKKKKTVCRLITQYFIGLNYLNFVLILNA